MVIIEMAGMAITAVTAVSFFVVAILTWIIGLVDPSLLEGD